MSPCTVRERVRGVELTLVLLVAVAAAFSPLAAAGSGPLAAADEPDFGKARAELRAAADLARRQGITSEGIRVVEVVERTWPDARLGCGVRRPVLDPVPVPGFRLLLALGDRRYVYHADRRGRIVACDRPAKPIDRIQ